MKPSLSLPIGALAFAAAVALLPALAQHAGHEAVPANPAPAATPSASEHAGHVMTPTTAPPASEADRHATHSMPTSSAASAADLPVGRDPAPDPFPLGAADALFGAGAMQNARSVLAEEHGGAVLWKVMLDQAEFQTGRKGAGYGWDAEAWIGGDLNRFVLKTEGQGTSRDGVEDAEWQALYSRAIGPYTDLQAGIRQDVGSTATTHAAFGVEALLPYWFKADAALFLSTRGDAFARLEGTYDLFLTQRIVLRPSIELNIAMQSVPAAQLGSGLTDVTAGLRVRYDITRNLSPYIGVEFRRAIGETETFHRLAGEPVENTRFVFGIRTFF